MDLWKLGGAGFLDAVRACYPKLGLAELARLHEGLSAARPALAQEIRERFFAEYGLRWNERLQETLELLLHTPADFQEMVDEKGWGARDLAPLLALAAPADISPFLEALTQLPASKAQSVQALEWVVELSLMGRQVRDLLPTDDQVGRYLENLERWRRPLSAERDEQWRKRVTQWPWPSQVQGQWQRFGDQSGLEIKIRTTSPQDFHKKLERLLSIRDTWSCNG